MAMNSMRQHLPIDDVLPELRRELRKRNVVLQASPGAGKTTRVPIALLNEDWLAGRRIIMLEPRRIAARNAAYFMARELAEAVGETVGYRVRLDSKVSSRTRVEVVTEGVLTRMLQQDPALEAAGLIIFDEFHERSLNADLGLALCLDMQSGLREDLRLLVMSATLEEHRLLTLLNDAAMIRSEGRVFPVETRYITSPNVSSPEQNAVAAVLKALQEETGNILVFLPGVGEIKRVQRVLEERISTTKLLIAPLYGELTIDRQEHAIQLPPPGWRKVVLATSVAETSLTIEGVRVVIDTGLSRSSKFDPRTGMSRLVTTRVSQASADQRRGRAGRLEPGVCYRLWSEDQQRSLPQQSSPEIMEADLTGLVLELAEWGVDRPQQLKWLTEPPASAVAQARQLLALLGALDKHGRITAHGKRMAAFGAHPRLAHMMLKGGELQSAALACKLAALINERDIFRGNSKQNADLTARLEVLINYQQRKSFSQELIEFDPATCQRAADTAKRWQSQLHAARDDQCPIAPGVLLAFAYPDRIAQRRADSNKYLLANGRGALLRGDSALFKGDYLVVVHLDDIASDARILLASSLAKEDLLRFFASSIEVEEVIEWDARSQSVRTCLQQRLGKLVIEEKPLVNPQPESMTNALLQGIREAGLAVLPWTSELNNWQARVQLLHRLGIAADQTIFPDVSEQVLMANLEQWLGPYLVGMTRLDHLKRLPLKDALYGLLSWRQQQALEELAPASLTVPSGSRIAIDYLNDSPMLAVRLQELFGLQETPVIAQGKVRLILQLLSPARRPVQVTQDLKNFWASTYLEVKKDLKGRYPKHYWPDDPLQAEATRTTRRRS